MAFVQRVVEVHEVRAAHRGAAFLVVMVIHFGAGRGVQFRIGILAVLVEPIDRQAVFVGAVDGPDLPHLGACVLARHVVDRQLQAASAVHGRAFLLGGQGFGRVVLGRHPMGDGLGKHGQRPCQEHREQQPGKPQADPGMQPGHG
ncbi:hypothetical protein G6F22_016783 [Rhizopus arrhizus]|nr:hypothetical protein G6F22_016783 [Rhizopus arrhizus]